MGTDVATFAGAGVVATATVFATAVVTTLGTLGANGAETFGSDCANAPVAPIP